MDLTRSADIPQLEDLLYVVSFGEGQGSAVLGADKRVDEIFAILDQTVLTAEDLLPNGTRSGVEIEDRQKDLQDMLTDMITNAASEQVQNSSRLIPGGDFTPLIPRPTYRTVKENISITGPLLQTKWHQRAPFDRFCFDSVGNQAYAGCVAIAMGQILRQMQYPNPNTVESSTYSWNSIAKFDYGYSGIPTRADSIVMGGYIHHLGVCVNMGYSTGGSGSNISEAVSYFNEIGLEANSESPTQSTISRMIIDDGNSVYVRGSGTDGGHAWVLDGVYTYTQNTYETRYSSLGSPLPETLFSSYDYFFVHANFGWAGKCDGYYTFNAYDLSQMKTGDMIEEDSGDIPYPVNSNYNINIQIVNITE